MRGGGRGRGRRGQTRAVEARPDARGGGEARVARGGRGPQSAGRRAQECRTQARECRAQGCRAQAAGAGVQDAARLLIFGEESGERGVSVIATELQEIFARRAQDPPTDVFHIVSVHDPDEIARAQENEDFSHREFVMKRLIGGSLVLGYAACLLRKVEKHIFCKKHVGAKHFFCKTYLFLSASPWLSRCPVKKTKINISFYIFSGYPSTHIFLMFFFMFFEIQKKLFFLFFLIDRYIFC